MPTFEVWVTTYPPRSKRFVVQGAPTAQAAEEAILPRLKTENPYRWTSDDPPNDLMAVENIDIHVEEIK